MAVWRWVAKLGGLPWAKAAILNRRGYAFKVMHYFYLLGDIDF